MEGKNAYQMMVERVKSKNDEDLKGIWHALQHADFCASDPWDPASNITMDDWMECIYSEMTTRGLPCLHIQ